MDFETLGYELEDNILTLTLNRPERLNAFNRMMMQELIAALDAADEDDAVRAIIITGAGRGFCAGADLEQGGETFNYAARSDREDARMVDGKMLAPRDGGGLLTLRIFECNKPVIAAVNGPAVGVGVTMQLPMDVRIASESAKFGFVFARRGIVPEACSSWFLPRIVGISQALHWCYSGRVFPAAEALAGGLVNEVLPPDELLPRAREIAREIADNTSAVSVTMMRHMFWRMLGADHPMEAHKLDSRGIYTLGQSADAREGITAFLEKRSPEFPGKPSQDMPTFFPWWQERDYG